MHSRTLDHDGQRYTVDGEPLRFFHFSGFDPGRPHLLSRHQTRNRLSECPALARICREYAEEAIAEGFNEARVWPYGFDRLPDGSRFTGVLRRLFAAAEREGTLTRTPYTDLGYAAFLAWLAQVPDGAPAPVNRVLLEIYERRPDVRAEFPDALGRDLARFLEWAGTSADADLALPQALKPPPPPGQPWTAALDSTPTAEPPAAPTTGTDANEDEWPQSEGVNVVGYFQSELGVGEAARQVVSALDAAGIAVLPVHGRTIPLNRQGHAFYHLDHRHAHFPVNLVCMNADALPEFTSQAGPGFFENRYSIGLWFWEVSTFPDRWRGSFDLLHEVWAPTQHVADALSALSPIPIVKMTLPVQRPSVPARTRAELGLPEGFVFLFSFDYRSVFARKNPLATIEAFKRCFAPGEGASLVMKCINEHADPANHERLALAAADHPDVHVLAGYVSVDDKNALTARCDCYVSLHRAEGFGLGMAEAMLLGKPVIATGYSGNLEFMSHRNSHLVDFRLVRIGDAAEPYPADGEWAEPDVGHAAALMRQVFDDPEAARELGRRGASDVARTHSAEAAGAVMSRRLELVARRIASPPRRVLDAPKGLAGLPEWVAAGPAPPPPARAGRLGEAGRRLAVRAMRPFTAYQDAINGRAVTSLEGLLVQTRELDAQLARARVSAADEQASVQAELMAQLRRVDDELRADLHAELSAVRGDAQRMLARVEAVARDVARMEAEARAIPYTANEPFIELHHSVAGRVSGYRDDESAGGAAGAYRAFEDTFRGSEAFIRDRQERFLGLIDGHEPVLDFGCGRGEFLDLLGAREIEYLGVDMDAGMVERCHEKGHLNVVNGDGLEYLDGLEDGSLGVVFAAQVIEHLGYDDLLRFLALSRAKLAADGLLVVETVNPHSPSALKTFWVDLTHRHPIFPEVALALCRESGFTSAFVFHPNGVGDVENDRFTRGEYAVVAGGSSLLDGSRARRSVRRAATASRANGGRR